MQKSSWGESKSKSHAPSKLMRNRDPIAASVRNHSLIVDCKIDSLCLIKVEHKIYLIKNDQEERKRFEKRNDEYDFPF